MYVFDIRQMILHRLRQIALPNPDFGHLTGAQLFEQGQQKGFSIFACLHCRLDNGFDIIEDHTRPFRW